MPYATLANLVESYNQDLLDRLATRAGEDGTAVDHPAKVSARATQQLLAASGTIDGYLQSRYAVPVVTPSLSFRAALQECCCAIAVANLVMQKGFLAESEDESLIAFVQKRYFNAPNGWLYQIGKGIIVIPGAVSDVTEEGQTAAIDGYAIGSEEPFFPPASSFR